MAPVEFDITTPTLTTDTSGLLDATNVVKPGEVQPTPVVVDESP